MEVRDNEEEQGPLPEEYEEELNMAFARFRQEISQIGMRFGYHRMVFGLAYTESKEDIETGSDLPYYTGASVATEILDFFTDQDVEGMFREMSGAWTDMADAIKNGEMQQYHREVMANTPGNTVH